MILKKKTSGFTLIELMIVVAIIGILAAVAVPKFADLVTKSKEASVKGALGSVRSALSIYYGDTEGIYPQEPHAALTTANKYLPSVGSQQSLGRFVVPPHSNSTGNPGHNSAFFQNASSPLAVRVDSGTPMTITTGAEGTESLVYGTNPNTLGELYLNCAHVDTKTTNWSTY